MSGDTIGSLQQSGDRKAAASWADKLTAILEFVWNGGDLPVLKLPSRIKGNIEDIAREYRRKHEDSTKKTSEEYEKNANNLIEKIRNVNKELSNAKEEVINLKEEKTKSENQLKEVHARLIEAQNSIEQLASRAKEAEKQLEDLRPKHADLEAGRLHVEVLRHHLNRHMRELKEQKAQIRRTPDLVLRSDGGRSAGRQREQGVAAQIGRLTGQSHMAKATERRLLTVAQEKLVQLLNTKVAGEQLRGHALHDATVRRRANALQGRLLREANDEVKGLRERESALRYALTLLRAEANVLRRTLRFVGMERLDRRRAWATTQQDLLSVQREQIKQIEASQPPDELRRRLLSEASRLAASRTRFLQIRWQQAASEHKRSQTGDSLKREFPRVWKQPPAVPHLMTLCAEQDSALAQTLNPEEQTQHTQQIRTALLRARQYVAKSQEETLSLRGQLLALRLRFAELASALNRRTYVMLVSLILGFAFGNWHLVAACLHLLSLHCGVYPSR